MSAPSGGVLLVTAGSTSGSKKNGRRRARSASSVSPGLAGKVAPLRAAACAAAGGDTSETTEDILGTSRNAWRKPLNLTPVQDYRVSDLIPLSPFETR